MTIGVFDSGVGGLSVAQAIQKELPDAKIIYREDHEHIPYGMRPPEEILGFVVPIFQSMIELGCRVIVIACNTVSTTLAPILREKFTIPLVAMEPMIKPAAALTKTGTIAVCATPATLKSERYEWLKSEYASNISVLEPDCSEWAAMIEHNNIDDSKISKSVELYSQRNP
jgi:glutamate racemase